MDVDRQIAIWVLPRRPGYLAPRPRRRRRPAAPSPSRRRRAPCWRPSAGSDQRGGRGVWRLVPRWFGVLRRFWDQNWAVFKGSSVPLSFLVFRFFLAFEFIITSEACSGGSEDRPEKEDHTLSFSIFFGEWGWGIYHEFSFRWGPLIEDTLVYLTCSQLV